MTLWRHKKRGSVYEIITEHASLQMAGDPPVEDRYQGENFTVYRHVKTGSVWIRPTKEFHDGRFEKVGDAEGH